VFSGERVMQELRKAASKESSRAKGNCDETRCLEDVAIALQTENVAMVHVTKTEGGYLLSISIKNVMTNQAVFDKSLPCEGCSVFKVIDKLKELGSELAPMAVSPAAETPQAMNTTADPDSLTWAEAQKSDTIEYYQAYIDSNRKGKYIAFAKARIKKLKEITPHLVANSSDAPVGTANASDAETALWNGIRSTNRLDDYDTYLAQYPKGKYAALARNLVKKLQDAAEAEAWQLSESNGKETDYQSYLQKYPQGKYAELAKVRVQKIQAEEAARVLREDDALWDTVKGSEIASNVQRYLDRYSTGTHIAAARAKLIDIANKEEEAHWQRVQSSENAANVQTYLDRYPYGVHAVAARAKLVEIATKEEEMQWQRIQSSEDDEAVNSFLRKYPNGANKNLARDRLAYIYSKKIKLGAFTSTKVGENSIYCTSHSIAAPNRAIFSEYIRAGLFQELRSKSFYSENATNLISGKLEKIDFSRWGQWSWNIELTLNSSNGNSITISEDYIIHEHYTPRGGDTKGCDFLEESLVGAVKEFVGKVVSSPKFAKLLEFGQQVETAQKVRPVLYDLDQTKVPQHLMAKSSLHSIALNWDDLGSSKIKQYQIYRSKSESDGFIKIGIVNTNSFIDRGLEPDGKYFYRVATETYSGNVGAASATVSGISVRYTPPKLDTVQVEPSTWGAKMVWKPIESEFVKGYSIYKRDANTFAKIAETTKPEFTINALTPNTKYIYYIGVDSYDGTRSELIESSFDTLP